MMIAGIGDCHLHELEDGLEVGLCTHQIKILKTSPLASNNTTTRFEIIEYLYVYLLYELSE